MKKEIKEFEQGMKLMSSTWKKLEVIIKKMAKANDKTRAEFNKVIDSRGMMFLDIQKNGIRGGLAGNMNVKQQMGILDAFDNQAQKINDNIQGRLMDGLQNGKIGKELKTILKEELEKMKEQKKEAGKTPDYVG